MVSTLNISCQEGITTNKAVSCQLKIPRVVSIKYYWFVFFHLLHYSILYLNHFIHEDIHTILASVKERLYEPSTELTTFIIKPQGL